MSRLHLICPTEDLFLKMSGRNFHSPALMAVAAVTPPDWEIVVTQMQKGDRLVYHDDVDVVGITMMTNQAIAGYAIADRYRALGKKVALGGIHPSVRPEEALEHGDAVVVGEVEGVWHDVLDDLTHNRSRGIYRTDGYLDMARVPPLRTDIFGRRGNSFSVDLVQVSRGCPHNCEFCSVTNLFGPKFRIRPVQNVLDEVAAGESSNIFFLDDNIISSPPVSKELFRGLEPLKKRWVGQASLNVFSRPDLLEAAARSGCVGIFLGIESIVSDNLHETGSFRKNRFDSHADLSEKIKRIVDHGIFIMASIVFGLDHDTPDVFKRTVDFLVENDVAFSSLPILTPYPGSGTFDRLHKEGRIFNYDWRSYNNEVPVFWPARLTPAQLKMGADWASYEFYRYKYLPRRFLTHRDHPFVVTAVTVGWHTECKKYQTSWHQWRDRHNGHVPC